MVEAGEGGLLYETDAKSGERVLVRSMESNRCAYLRFINRTGRPIDVWWRDYAGLKRHFFRLAADTYYNVDTFITHPWEFSDAKTNERYVINNQPIFRAPSNLGGMMYRTNWNVTITVRSLRKTVLLFLSLNLTNPDDVDPLGLPLVLAEELKDMVKLCHCEPPPSS